MLPFRWCRPSLLIASPLSMAVRISILGVETSGSASPGVFATVPTEPTRRFSADAGSAQPLSLHLTQAAVACFCRLGSDGFSLPFLHLKARARQEHDIQSHHGHHLWPTGSSSLPLATSPKRCVGLYVPKIYSVSE